MLLLWMILILLLSSADFFFKFNFFKASQSVKWSVSVLFVLIWEQTVCKGYHQAIKVAVNKKRVRKPRK